ncbi:MAG: sugar ABC transporter ATP-binding protein [Oscillospiraceae bacterium]|nr:sugar ABC transporter ATP-binding protein [Oscillospiraceae bacterium]MCI9362707.1 sugar ABC transporter ATP-binding protein [Oscillospiraceae bacterium]MCI9668572.1 sugar ABC transporter ATP-binding protein [Oscillospiraceae bacterium]RKJ57902.1 sugar ABC transporter ATP-binding protein [bacterium 1XD42-8]RKJ66702.1 sugar ABC transporter ATP-binding protein [bacterium 1XD42-1]
MDAKAKIDFSDIILKLENINKSFPGVKALQNMQIELARGEMHAVCGENGAGKSTMMKVITGVHKADSGNIYLNGEKVTIREPNDAYGKGIAIIFQETSLFKDLTVLENMFMGHEPIVKLGGFIHNIDYAAMRKKADEIFDFLGITGQIDYDAKIDNLGVASKQMVEIAKALTYDAKVLIFDEPTAALTNKEVRALFRTIARLKDQGMSMLYISHRMEEIFEIADRVTIIRDGSYVNTAKIEEVTEQQLIAWMVGREMNEMYPKAQVEIGSMILKVEDLCRSGEKDGFPLDHVSFEVRRGEIFGIAGLAGAGRTEMAECLCGLRKYDSGHITLEGKDLAPKNYREAINDGFIYVSEDRKKYGLVVAMSIEENLTMSILYRLTKNKLIDFDAEDRLSDEYMKDLRVKAPSREFIVENLSGGNQQKVLVAKALCAKPKILILDEPTRGVDVGAKSEIHRIVSSLAQTGLTIIMISSDMPELLGMCDRLMVLKAGKKTGVLERDEFSQEKVLKLAL